MSRNTQPTQPELPIASLSNDAVAAELSGLLSRAGDDERRVMLFIARRIVNLGQDCYGKLDIGNDTRDGQDELNEELSDALFYVAYRSLKEKLAPQK